jgi:hypothetical protein
MRHAQALALLESPQKEACLKSSFLRERRRLHPSVQPNQRFVVRAHCRTKSRKARNALLTDAAIEAICAMPQLPGCDLVFYHPDSLDRWAEARDPWGRARKAAGHEWLQIKDLRRAYGIRLAEAGCPMSYIKEAMGHASVGTTEKHYAYYSPQSAVEHVLAVLQGGRRCGGRRSRRNHSRARRQHQPPGQRPVDLRLDRLLLEHLRRVSCSWHR